MRTRCCIYYLPEVDPASSRKNIYILLIHIHSRRFSHCSSDRPTRFQLAVLTCMLMRRSVLSVGSVTSTAAIWTAPNYASRLLFFVLQNLVVTAACRQYCWQLTTTAVDSMSHSDSSFLLYNMTTDSLLFIYIFFVFISMPAASELCAYTRCSHARLHRATLARKWRKVSVTSHHFIIQSSAAEWKWNATDNIHVPNSLLSLFPTWKCLPRFSPWTHRV